MADYTVAVTTIPTRTGDTVASYNVYSDVMTPGTAIGTLSVAEALAGKVFTLTDGLSHNVSVKTVWTTYGESTSNESNIEVIDLTVVTNKYLEFLAAQTDKVDIPFSVDPAVDFYWEIKFRLKSLVNSGQDAGIFGVTTAPVAMYAIYDLDKFITALGSTSKNTTAPAQLNVWQTLKMNYTAIGTSQVVTLNGTPSSSSIGTFTAGTAIVKAGKVNTAFTSDVDIDYIDLNGDMFDFNSISAGQVTGSVSGPITITTDRADVNDMLIAV